MLSWIFGGLCIFMLLMIFVFLFFGWVIDKVGCKLVYFVGVIVIMLVVWFYFVLLGLGEYWKVVVVFIFVNSVMFGIF